MPAEVETVGCGRGARISSVLVFLFVDPISYFRYLPGFSPPNLSLIKLFFERKFLFIAYSECGYCRSMSYAIYLLRLCIQVTRVFFCFILRGCTLLIRERGEDATDCTRQLSQMEHAAVSGKEPGLLGRIVSATLFIHRMPTRT